MSNKSMTWEEAVTWLKKEPDQQKLVRAAFYDDPLIKAAERFSNSSEWSAVRKLLPNINKGKVLDVGAGRGISSFAFSKDGWDVTALEPDPSDVVGAGAIRSLAKQANINIKIIETWGEGLPFPDNEFDVVYCRAVLHHANDLKKLCKEAFRVLKLDGLFLATREHVISKKEDLQRFLDSHPLHHLYGGENAYLLSEYIDAIKMPGFKVEKILNPAASDINLYPETLADAKKRTSLRYHVPSILIPEVILKVKAAFSNSPGRHYSFVARKVG